MLRAATLGAVNFARFDPWDTWWWKRFYVILDELGRQQNVEALRAQHNHHLALVANSRLTSDSWDECRVAAGEALNRILKNIYPWRADEIGEAGTHTSRERAVEQYQEMVGKPGEPRYEHMVSELRRALVKRTDRQKELDRKRRRERHAQYRQEHEAQYAAGS